LGFLQEPETNCGERNDSGNAANSNQVKGDVVNHESVPWVVFVYTSIISNYTYNVKDYTKNEA